MNFKSLITYCLTIVFLLVGCSSKTPAPREVVAREFDSLVVGEEQTPEQKVMLGELFASTEKNEKTDEELAQTFALFFKDFTYKITGSSAKDGQATVDVDLTTIDANLLAKDFVSQSIIKQIQGLASPSSVTYSSNDYYHSLYTLLSENEYPTKESTCTINLVENEDEWQIAPQQNLEDALTGGFVSAVSDPNLFTPEEIAIIYLGTIKEFDKEQMSQFLALDSLSSADDEYKREFSQALTEQILKCFSYQIKNSTSNGDTATVTADITSYDANSIINNFTEQMATYTATSQSLEDGIGGRMTKANQVLLDCINQNTASTTTEITLHLTNDGTIWELNMDEALVQAILGDIQGALGNAS